MPSLRTLLVAGVLTLIAGIVIAFPARVAYQWVSPPGVALNGIEGTLWNGQAREATAGGIYLADLRWRFHPLALLTGHAEFAISATPVSGSLQADVAAGADGSLRLSNVAAAMPVSALDRIVAVSGLAGDINVRLERLTIDNGLPVEAVGTVDLANLVIRPLAPSPLGNFQATLETENGVVRGDVKDVAGVLDVSGKAELHPDRSYVFAGLIGSRQGAPATVEEQLRYLGSADAQGRRRFRLEGQL